MAGEIKTNQTIAEHYETSLTSCAKDIETAEKDVSEDNFTNCDSVTKPKTVYSGTFISLVSSYSAKLKADVKNFGQSCEALQELDYKRALDIKCNL